MAFVLLSITLLALPLLVIGQMNVDHVQSECDFPPEWNGTWIYNNDPDVLMINRENLGSFGICFRQVSEDQFILYDKMRQCYKCALIFDRHINALQYKEGPCEEFSADTAEEIMAGLCDRISPDEPLYTIVRISGEDIQCPFAGKYTYTYTTGQRSCQFPVSKLTQCMTESMVAFNFQACPDGQTQSKDTYISEFVMERKDTGVEELTCKANWTDGQRTYLIGFLKQPFVSELSAQVRCFLYKRTERGFRVAQSYDAGCFGLRRIRDGFRTMTLTEELTPINANEQDENNITVDDGEDNELYGEEVKEDVACTFPDWFTSLSPLLSFSFTYKYEFNEDANIMLVSNYSYISSESHLKSKTTCLNIDEVGTTFDEELGEEKENHVRMLTRVTAGCTTMFKCLSIYRRTDFIVEIQEGTLTQYENEACSRLNMNVERLKFTALMPSEMDYQPCTAGGQHNVTEINLKGVTDPCQTGGGFQEMVSRCNADEQIEFVRSCSQQGEDAQASVFFCMGGWEEQIPYESLPKGGKHPHHMMEGSFYDNSDYGLFGSRPSGSSGGATSERFGQNRAKYSARDMESREDRYYNEFFNRYDEAMDLPPENVTLGYMIARPKSRSSNAPLRVCFIYTYFNDTFSWTVDITGCIRNIRPGSVGKFMFNTTRLVTCGTSGIRISSLLFSLQLVAASTLASRLSTSS